VVSGKANRTRYVARIARTGSGIGVSVALLAGCAAGQNAQTSKEKSVIDGVNVTSGSISLDDVSVSSPSDGAGYTAGADAPVDLVIVNSGTTPDTLISVTADPSVAKSVTISRADPSVSDGATPLTTSGSSPLDSDTPNSASVGGTASSSPELSGAPSGSGADSGSAAPTGSAADSVPIPIPVGTSVRIGQPGAASIVLNDLAAPLYPAQNITLVFTFSNGETISALTNVHLGADDSGGPTLATEPSSDT
jgi:hypothetical protein